MSQNVVEVKHLVKYFDGRCVLDDIDFVIPQGCVYGLLGRNGTGKTTIIRILMGLESASRGCTCLFGNDSTKLATEIKERIGYVAEAHNLIQDYIVSRLSNLCRGLSKNWNSQFFSQLIEKFHLPVKLKVKELSIGMRAQLNLSLAMAKEPELLILDDPTLGLDTVARRQFLELAVDLLQQDGRTILYSSHILSDVERIADRIGILVGGKLVVDCELEELKKRIKKFRLIFPERVPINLHLTEIIRQQAEGRELTITVANWNVQKQDIINCFKPTSCTEIPMSLEDIFIECTKPNLRGISNL